MKTSQQLLEEAIIRPLCECQDGFHGLQAHCKFGEHVICVDSSHQKFIKSK